MRVKISFNKNIYSIFILI